MRPILLVAILELLITNTAQNLIRYGDFQNIFAYPSVFYVVCGTYCDGIWYTHPQGQIQLIVNSPVPGQNHTTTMVDMVYGDYIELCQDFFTVEIGKTYQYSFDSHCNIYCQIENCSVWVILNGQVINGSNHSHADLLVHHNVGYMNITKQNNTICFTSQEFPFYWGWGTYLDNVTLQIYTGKIPCNVLNCKFCKLNFPNICQVCQHMFILQSSSCQCQSKFYLKGSICKICLFPCETCQGQARNCLSCPKNYRLQKNQCVIAQEWTLAASAIASMPGIEFFSIGQIFLAISDQFWPYYSHHRVYGNQTIDILTFFHTLQNNKWFLLSFDKKINFNFQSLNFSDYSGYSNQQFLKMESRASYFWDGAFELTFYSFPTMLIVFFLFNKIFYLTFEYRISRHFRPFSFLFMIYFLGIGDEISYLSFLSFNNGMNLFSFKFQDKVGHIVWIMVFFLLVLFCSGGYLIVKFLYDKLSKHFIDNFFPKLQSLHILSCLSMKAFVIGSVNALLATNYETLIISLGSIQMVFLIGVIYIQWNHKCYKIQTFMFLYMLKSVIMAIFNVSLWIDWKMRESEQSNVEQQKKKLMDFNCKALMIVIIGLGVLQAISIYFSGREMVNHRGLKQVSDKIQKGKRQVLKTSKLKQNVPAKDEIKVKQKVRAQNNYLYQTSKALKKDEKQVFFLNQHIKEQKDQDQATLEKKFKSIRYYSLIS